jgi:hypothetical protein
VKLFWVERFYYICLIHLRRYRKIWGICL